MVPHERPTMRSAAFTPSIFFQIVYVCCILQLVHLPRVTSFVVDIHLAWRSCPNPRIRTGLTCPVKFHHSSTFFRGSSIATSLQSVVIEDNDDTTNACSNDDAESDTGRFFWDFQGHSCYAEVVQPTTSSKKSEDRKKPTVLLIHGFACSTVYWRETRSYLTKAGYTVHLVDLLGQGKSAKPGRNDNVIYSIDLWAKMVDEYSHRYIDRDDDDENGSDSGVVLVGNSLGSVVALSAATGDCYNDETNSNSAHLPSRVKGLCFFNCGVGMNTQNALKTVSSKWVKSIVSVFFDVLNLLVFNNKALLTYVIDEQVSKEVIRNALIKLYAYAEDPETKVDDELVDSFIDPVLNDSTSAVVEVLSQIYTNDAGRTPMELQTKYLSEEDNHSKIPIHLIWGDKDPIAPMSGAVGTFYSKLASTSNSGISFQVINDAGHVPFDERPECNSGLIEWLAEKIE